MSPARTCREMRPSNTWGLRYGRSGPKACRILYSLAATRHKFDDTWAEASRYSCQRNSDSDWANSVISQLWLSWSGVG